MNKENKNQPETSNHNCQVCHEHFDDLNLFPIELIRPNVLHFIKSKHPDISSTEYICLNDLKQLRSEYIENILKRDKKEIETIEKKITKSMQEQEFLSKNVNTDYDSYLKFGERLADKIAVFGGSWKFIILFGSILMVWIIINSIFLLRKPFDPYPFILLNLILSCLAALQAPVIMMSQNRQETKDRLRAENDYMVNLKSELEIRMLNEKMDHLLMKQWQRLMDIQQFQTEIMEEILNKKEK